MYNRFYEIHIYIYIAQLVKYLSSYPRTIIFTNMSEGWGMCLPPSTGDRKRNNNKNKNPKIGDKWLHQQSAWCTNMWTYMQILSTSKKVLQQCLSVPPALNMERWRCQGTPGAHWLSHPRPINDPDSNYEGQWLRKTHNIDLWPHCCIHSHAHTHTHIWIKTYEN